MEFTFRMASLEDAEAIASLVNRAYRPTSDLKRWTHEALLVAGERTTVEQVMSLNKTGAMLFVLCRETKIVACVSLEIAEGDAYVGMLATEPNMHESHQLRRPAAKPAAASGAF
ncbi:MAG: hypothetical protein ABI343_17125 [Burkholderiaceae bacterium]